MKVVVSVFVLLLGVAFCYSQETQTVTERARQLRMDSYKILSSTPHRVKITIESRATEESPWELYSSMTDEVASPTRRHVVQHFGPGTLRREYIYIDRQTYMKLLPDGPWQLLPDSYTGATVRQLGGVSSSAIDERKDGNVVDTRSQGRLQVIRTGEIVDLDTKTKEWFDDSGRLIRTEVEQWNHDRKRFQRRTEEFQYDPTIKVEAPIN